MIRDKRKLSSNNYIKPKTNQSFNMKYSKEYIYSKRRSNANEREKKRMHLLNQSLDKLRKIIPLPYNLKDYSHHNSSSSSSSSISSKSADHTLKLPKIETLILAKNYIEVLSKTVESQEKWEYDELIKILAKDLRENTRNLLKSKLIIDPEILNEIIVNQHVKE